MEESTIAGFEDYDHSYAYFSYATYDTSTTIVDFDEDDEIGPVIFYVDYKRLTDPYSPLWMQIPLTVIFVLLFLIGIIGNVSTSIVIKYKKTMHTTANFYLASLAISDLLLITISPPFAIMVIWQSGATILLILYQILSLFIICMTVTVSVLTMVMFTIERYIAICHPFYAHKISSLHRAKRFIKIIWVFGFVFIPIRFIMADKSSIWLNFFLCYMLPLVLLTILYSLIIYRIRQSNGIRKFSGNSDNFDKTADVNQQNTKTIKILVAVVIMFFICWTPYNLLPFFRNFTNVDDELLNLITQFVIILYCFSACVNPILYSLMSNKFRKAFKETFSYRLMINEN